MELAPEWSLLPAVLIPRSPKLACGAGAACQPPDSRQLIGHPSSMVPEGCAGAAPSCLEASIGTKSAATLHS